MLSGAVEARSEQETQFKVRSAQTDCGDFEPQSLFVKVNISELISELLTHVFLSVPSSCLLSQLHRLNVQRAEGLISAMFHCSRVQRD